MADIRLAKPEMGTSTNIPGAGSARYVFDFPASDSTLLRDGDDLVINFPDGSQIALQDFYGEFDAENPPTFEIDGREIDAEEFFTAMNEPDLMPAAGPGADGADDGGRYHDFGDSALAAGIDHLLDLDWGMSLSRDYNEEFNSYGRRGDDGDPYERGVPGSGLPSEGLRPQGPSDTYEPPHGYVPPQAPAMPSAPVPPVAEFRPEPPAVERPSAPDYPVSVRPENPARPDQPRSPEVPANPGYPDDPGLPGGNPWGSLAVNGARDILTVHEKYLANGTEAGDGPTTVPGVMLVDAPDGVSRIEISGITVWENGSLAPNPVIPTEDGNLRVSGFDPATGRLTYEYTLENPTSAHDPQKTPGGDESVSHTFTVVVTDTDGDQGASSIKVNIVDDVPLARDDSAFGNVNELISGNVLDNDIYGADGQGSFENGASVRWDVPGAEAGTDGEGRNCLIVVLPEGIANLYEDGSWTFKADNYDDGLLPSFNYTIVDRDGDVSSAKLDININYRPKIVPADPGSSDADENLGVTDNNIVADESAIPGLGNGGHDEHSHAGTGAFVVKMYGERGTILLGDEESAVEITISGENADQAAIGANTDIILNNGTEDYFRLTVTGVKQDANGNWLVFYGYELLGPVNHVPGHGFNEDEPFGAQIAISAIQEDGDRDDGVLNVEIHDDIPVISIDGSSVELATDTMHTGRWTHDFGADAPGTGVLHIRDDEGNEHRLDLSDSGNFITIDSAGGKLTVGADGSYEFAGNNGHGSTDKFTFLITDADGDVANADITLNVGALETEVTVLTPNDDKWPDSDNLGSDSNNNDVNNIVIADIHGQTEQTGRLNVALLVDLSSSIGGSLSTMQTHLKNSIDSLYKLVEDGHEVNVLLVGFNLFARNYTNVSLKTSDDVDTLKNAIGKFVLGGKDGDEFLNDFTDAGAGNTLVCTNYEHAFDLAQEWFSGQNGGSHHTFFITDGTPTAHVHNTSWKTVKHGVAWKPGQTGSVTIDEVEYHISETGVLTYASNGSLVLGTPPDGTGPQDWGTVSPIVLQKVNGVYQPCLVTGSFQTENDLSSVDSKEAVAGLKDVSTVHVIGMGDNIKGESLKAYDSNGNPAMGDFSGLSGLIDKIIVDITPGKDVVNGGGGRDILFGDRLVDTLENDGAKDKTLKQIADWLGIRKPVSEAEWAAAGVMLFDKADEMAAKIDEFDPDGIKGGADTLIGGADSDLLYGMGGNDLLFGDGTAASADKLLGVLGDVKSSVRRSASFPALRRIKTSLNWTGSRTTLGSLTMSARTTATTCSMAATATMCFMARAAMTCSTAEPGTTS